MRYCLTFLASLVIGASLRLMAEEKREVGNDVQVFVDEHLIESMKDLVRRVIMLKKHPANPVLRPQESWEGQYVLPIAVIYDTLLNLYRMWYRNGPDKFAIAHATSKDGIHWEKTPLHQREFKGSRENNMLSLRAGMAWNGILLDARAADPSKRYKMISYNRASKSNGLFVHVSADGLNWKAASDKAVVEGLADTHTLMGWDSRIERYVAYVRPDLPVRTIARITSEDMIHWSEPQPVLQPDEDDPPGTQLYGMSVFHDHQVYYGFVWVYHPNQVCIDVQLALSRDGVKWQRAGRRHPLLTYGLPNQFDSHIVIAMQPIVRGDALKVYYLAEDAPHAVVFPNEAYPPLKASPPRSEQPWLKDRKGYVGLATASRDRIVGLVGGNKPGEVTTKAFRLQGKDLRLNGDASRGELRVEVLDEKDQPIQGYTLAASRRVKGDSPELAVTWKKQSDLSALVGRTIKLRITVQDAKLYALQVRP